MPVFNGFIYIFYCDVIKENKNNKYVLININDNDQYKYIKYKTILKCFIEIPFLFARLICNSLTMFIVFRKDNVLGFVLLHLCL